MFNYCIAHLVVGFFFVFFCFFVFLSVRWSLHNSLTISKTSPSLDMKSSSLAACLEIYSFHIHSKLGLRMKMGAYSSAPAVLYILLLSLLASCVSGEFS